MSDVRRIKIRLAYEGTAFHGWERQIGLPTVQGTVEDAVEKVTGETVTVTGAGRTDAGVSAIGQCAHFPMAGTLPVGDIARALNAHLPETVQIRDAAEVDDSFHARFSAQGKRYVYRIVSGSWQPPRWRSGHYFVRGALNGRAMAEAAAHFVGTRDFSSVASLIDGDKRNPVRELKRCAVMEVPADGSEFGSEAPGKLMIVIEGRSFLYKMVRGITGTLIDVGRGQRAADSIPAMLEARDRAEGGATAPPEGLTLEQVYY